MSDGTGNEESISRRIRRQFMEHDIILVGGGLAGAVLARALAEAGIRVLVLEREMAFKDRVRGEAMLCWGVAEARTLGIDGLLKETCGREMRYLVTQIDGIPELPVRDLVETSPHRAGIMNFYHPHMQAVMLEAAETAGATVRRGVTVIGISAGRPASVWTRGGGGEFTDRTHLVVAADGRESGCRKAAGFAVNSDPERMIMAGVLFEGLRAPEDHIHLVIRP